MKKKLLTLLLFIGFSFVFQSLFSQEKKDLKVGLVLSGGGAKGLAHIGVLKEIEKAGIRVDYIGGTSMGAIIGSLYAAGYSANQLDSIFNSTNFEKLIQDDLPRSAKTFYEKEVSARYAITLPFKGFKVSFPSAISKGQNIYNLTSRLLLPVSNIDDFSKLPIPFFCMATNVETGEPVKLDHGYLPEAILASGAFPSLFQPVEIGDKMLIDGGVVNNYPINEVKKMGADVIIGVDVQDDLAKRGDLNSAINILLQINNYRTVHDMQKKSKETDLYIKPDIKNFSVISFDQGRKIIDNGEAAGKKVIKQLDSIAALQRKEPKERKIEIPDTLHLSSLNLEGNQKYTRGYIKGKLRFQLGEKISFTKFNQGISNLSATNNFETIQYKLINDPDYGGEALYMKLKENPNDLFLRLGVHYDELYQTAGLINITKKHLLFDDDISSFDFIIGDRVRYNFEYLIDKGVYWSVGVKSTYNSFVKDVDFNFLSDKMIVEDPTADVNKVDIKFSDLTNQIYMQTLFKEEFVIGAGLEHKKIKGTTETISSIDSDKYTLDNTDYYSAFGFLTLDTFDNKYYPTTGLYFNGNFHYYQWASSFDQADFNPFSIAKARMGFATSLGGNFSLSLFTEGGFKIGADKSVNSLDFVLGGYGNKEVNNFTPFLGYDFLSFGGNSYIKATAKFDFKFAKRNHVNFTANIANAGDDIYEKEWLSLPDYTGYALGYGLETFMGPIEITYSYSPETGRSNWFFNVGYWF
ncbi:patatin-like phospholipase family protein [Zhouia sp. PK063]|uniref:patatin-like phospholipase family protein n=1 Tax=Zhouia sp. PK063 TaxID=3373602 RepID=UPI003788806A